MPRLGRGALALARWLLRRPQPMIALALVSAGCWALWRYAQRADVFRIEQVKLPAQTALKLREPLIGSNIWSLDIRSLSNELKRQQPSLKQVRVVRQLPDTIRIDAVPRVPIAQVHWNQWYPVDGEGFLLPEGQATVAERLVRLVGFDGSDGLQAGKGNDSQRLQLSLRVLKALRRAPALVSRRLTEINVADPQQIRFLLDLSGVSSWATETGVETEVRCGSEAELDAHLRRLQAALKVIARQPLAVQYIDVRFQEPVVGPRG